MHSVYTVYTPDTLRYTILLYPRLNHIALILAYLPKLQTSDPITSTTTPQTEKQRPPRRSNQYVTIGHGWPAPPTQQRLTKAPPNRLGRSVKPYKSPDSRSCRSSSLHVDLSVPAPSVGSSTGPSCSLFSILGQIPSSYCPFQSWFPISVPLPSRPIAVPSLTPPVPFGPVPSLSSAVPVPSRPVPSCSFPTHSVPSQPIPSHPVPGFLPALAAWFWSSLRIDLKSRR